MDQLSLRVCESIDAGTLEMLKEDVDLHDLVFELILLNERHLANATTSRFDSDPLVSFTTSNRKFVEM